MAPTSRRDEVLAIAGDLFARNGYASTTVRDIANAAGILSGSLYHHFPSKEAIVDGLLRPFLDELLARCDEVVASGLSPLAAFEALATAALDALDEHPTAVAIYEGEGRRLATLDHFDYVRTAEQRLAAAWTGVLERGVVAGELRPEVDPALTYAFVRATLWDVARWHRMGEAAADGGSARIADRQLDLLLHGVAAAVAPAAAAARSGPDEGDPGAVADEGARKKGKKGKKGKKR